MITWILNFIQEVAGLLMFRMRRILLILMTIVKKKCKRRPTEIMVRALQMSLIIMDKSFSAKINRMGGPRLPPNPPIRLQQQSIVII